MTPDPLNAAPLTADDATQALRVAMLFKLIGVTINPTPDGGIDVLPEPPELEPVVAWLRARPALALQAQADVAAASETVRQRAETLSTVLQELATDLSPDARGAGQVQAYYLAESVGWPLALILAAGTAASQSAVAPTDTTPLHTGLYL